MRVLYNAEEDSRGEIAIAATKEEWMEVIQVIAYAASDDAPDRLVNSLINQGVYE